MFGLMLLNKKRLATYSGPPPATNFALIGGQFHVSYTTVLNAVTKYSFSSDIVSTATSLVSAKIQSGAAGDIYNGFFFGGYFRNGSAATQAWLSTVDKYTYANNVTASSTNLAQQAQCSASGNDVLAIIFGQNSTATRYSTTEKYTYSNLSRATGTALSEWAECGVGNFTFSIMSFGWSGAWRLTSEKYIYASNVRVSGTSFKVPRFLVTAFGNSSIGIFSGGNQDPTNGAIPLNITEVYTYISDTVAASTSLLSNVSDGAATSNSAVGLVTNYTTVQKYNYVNKSFSAGTSLNTLPYGSALSSSPGWA